MLKPELKQIKDAIKDFKGNREFLNIQIKQIEERYNERIEETEVDYAWSEFFMNQRINSINYEKSNAIYNMCESYGNDTSIYIIYNNGTQCYTTGAEIVANECTPKMQHIVYAYYADGYVTFDTEIGEFNWDVEIDEEMEERENYMNSIEIKFNTDWGKRHRI